MSRIPPPPPAPPAPAASGAVCPLCGTARAGLDVRCAECGLHPGLGPGERDPFPRRAIAIMIGTFVGIYAFVLACVWAAS